MQVQAGRIQHSPLFDPCCCVDVNRQRLVLLSGRIWCTLYHAKLCWVAVQNSICFHPSESTAAILSWCSISWACLFWVMDQKRNALPTQRADNISDPIIYSVEDLHIPWLFLLGKPLKAGYTRQNYCQSLFLVVTKQAQSQND